MLSADHSAPEKPNRSNDINLVEGMRSVDAYPYHVDEIDFHETHISYIFLAGDFAYKIKKAIETPFLDYSTLERRQHFCHEELRLDSRYSDGLYVDVVPIVLDDGKIKVEGAGDPIEFAVKMHRFPKGALLAEQIDHGTVDPMQLHDLAKTIADFHLIAQRCDAESASNVPLSIHNNLLEVLGTLQSDECKSTLGPDIESTLNQIRDWAVDYFKNHRSSFESRAREGFIRECHGDLHLQNVVLWKGKFVPFDGIEFSDRFRWIDIASDVAFLVMDLVAKGHIDLSRTFINDYLESTGDYSALTVLRYYLVYRSLIRAMVSQISAKQHNDAKDLMENALKDCREHIKLASSFTVVPPIKLYITHGLSGSGKSTVSRLFISRFGAIRVRSDAERKRLRGIDLAHKCSENEKESLYNSDMSIATYSHLEILARKILTSGYSVIVDATFLKISDRHAFHQIASDEKVPFEIIDCQADLATLRERIVSRNDKGEDISDADLQVLEHQLLTQEPLDAAEQQCLAELTAS